MTASGRTWQSVVAWSLAGLTAVCVAVDTAITAASGPGLRATETVAVHGWPLIPGATLGSAVVGAVIISRYPKHLIGWLLLGTGIVSQLSVVSEAYSIWVHRDGGPGSEQAWQIAGWLSILFSGGVAVAMLGIVFLVAPDNRLLSRRWRPVLWLCLLGGALYVATAFSMRPSDLVVEDQDRPVGTLSSVLASSGALCIAVGVIAATTSLFVRLRRLTGEARLQLRWFAVAATLLTVGFAWLLLIEGTNGGVQTPLASLPLFTAFFLLPVLVAVAVLRHRLFDVDLIVSRTVGVAVATVLVGAGYVVVVLAVAGTAAGGEVWTSLLATAAVAIAFQPLRVRVVRMAHRLAYGRRAAPYEALADLSRQLGDSPDPEQLLPQVAGAAGRAVAATSVAVRLDVPGGPAARATWPSATVEPAAGETTALPVVDRGEPLGELDVTLPPGRALRDDERVLLERVAEQAGLAFRNARLAAELTARVAELDEQTDSLARSRQRLIEARDAERDRLEAAIRADVMRHLDPLPEQLDALADRLAGSPSRRRLDDLAEPAVAALEALRAITRGVYPAQLARFGLAAVLVRGDAHQTTVTIDHTAEGRRFPDRVEAATYFCVTELTRAADQPLQVWLGVRAGELTLEVSGALIGGGSFARMRDRVEAIGGRLTCDGPALCVQLPVEAAPTRRQPADAAQALESRSGPNADLVTYPAAPDSATNISPSASS